MTDHDDLAEQLADLIDGAAPPVAFEEVAARVPLDSNAPRARRLVAVAVVLTVIVGAGALAVESRHPTNRIMPAVVSTTTTATTSLPNVAATYRNLDPTGIMGVIGPRSGWRLDGNSFSRTDDNGATWHDITPPNAVNQDPIARIDWVDFLDSQHVWVPVAVNNAPFTIYRSDDGGTTWDAVCVGDKCGVSAEVTFLDRDHGWGIGYGPGGDLNAGSVYSTSDGGHTWTLLGPTPFVGPMHFLDLEHGWAVSEPSGYSGSPGLATKGGGDLYRTDDGGRTWTPFSPDIGGTLHFGIPQWFGNDGVVVAWSEPGEESGQHDQVRVYTTHDGGNSWRGQVAPPADDATDRYGNSPQLLAPESPFSASSPLDWMLFIGPDLYVTHDAGAHWDTLTPAPAITRVFSLAQTSASSAWALAMVPVCADPASTEQECRLEVLVHTDDGGPSWPAVPTP